MKVAITSIQLTKATAVLLEEKVLRRCFFVDFKYKELEVVQVEKEAIIFKVITKNRTVEFDNNKCKKKCYN